MMMKTPSGGILYKSRWRSTSNPLRGCQAQHLRWFRLLRQMKTSFSRLSRFPAYSPTRRWFSNEPALHQVILPVHVCHTLNHDDKFCSWLGVFNVLRVAGWQQVCFLFLWRRIPYGWNVFLHTALYTMYTADLCLYTFISVSQELQ